MRAAKGVVLRYEFFVCIHLDRTAVMLQSFRRSVASAGYIEQVAGKPIRRTQRPTVLKLLL